MFKYIICIVGIGSNLKFGNFVYIRHQYLKGCKIVKKKISNFVIMHTTVSSIYAYYLLKVPSNVHAYLNYGSQSCSEERNFNSA